MTSPYFWFGLLWFSAGAYGLTLWTPLIGLVATGVTGLVVTEIRVIRIIEADIAQSRAQAIEALREFDK